MTVSYGSLEPRLYPLRETLKPMDADSAGRFQTQEEASDLNSPRLAFRLEIRNLAWYGREISCTALVIRVTCR